MQGSVTSKVSISFGNVDVDVDVDFDVGLKNTQSTTSCTRHLNPSGTCRILI